MGIKLNEQYRCPAVPTNGEHDDRKSRVPYCANYDLRIKLTALYEIKPPHYIVHVERFFAAETHWTAVECRKLFPIYSYVRLGPAKN